MRFCSLSCFSWPATSGLPMTSRTCSAAAASVSFFVETSDRREAKSGKREDKGEEAREESAQLR